MSVAGKDASPTHRVSIAFLAVTYLLRTIGVLVFPASPVINRLMGDVRRPDTVRAATGL